MTKLTFETAQVGDALPELSTPQVSRTTLALFAGASGDHNPIHIDIDVARKAGMDDVFAQGMLPMAYLGRFLTDLVPQTAIREFNVRFMAITQLRNEIVCGGTIVEKSEKDGEHLVRLDIVAADQNGDVKLAGQALVALPQQ